MHPVIGKTRIYRGQVYTCIDAFEHITGDGRTVTLVKAETKCSDCGETLIVGDFTLSYFFRRRLNRRCHKCRRPGAPVGRVRRIGALSQPWPVQQAMLRVLVELAAEQDDKISPKARGWVRRRDWIRALVERGVFEKTDTLGKGPYYRARIEMRRRKMIEVKGPAVRPLPLP